MAQHPTHIVKSGDTLSAIAKKFGVKVGDISGFRSGDPNLIFPGERLTIGGQAVSPGQPGFIGPVRPTPKPAPRPSQPGFIGPVRPTPKPAPRAGQQGFIGPVRPSVSSTGTTPRGGQNIADFTRQFDLPQEEAQPRVEPEVTAQPEPPVTGTSAKERFDALRESFGLGQPPTSPFQFGAEEQGRLVTAQEEVEVIDAELTSILDTRLQIQEEMQKFTDELTGLPEAGRQGAVGEKSRELQRRLDSLNRRELVLETKKAGRNNTIANLMQLGRQSFADATAQYNQQFDRAMQIYSLVLDEEQDLQRSASSNLQVFSNAIQTQIQSGDLTFDQISGVQWQQIAELELQAEIPQGITAEVLRSAKKSILSTILSKDKSQATILYEDGTSESFSTGVAPSIDTGDGFTLSPGQIRFDEQGRVVARGGEKEVSEKRLTQSQFAARGFGTRMQQADTTINQLEEGGFEPSRIQGRLPNFLKSDNQQVFEQAQRNFINALLRRESGAAIAESEFESAEQQYFSQPGDSDTVKGKKRENRNLVITNMLQESGQQLGEPDIESFRAQLRTGEFLVREVATGNILAITSAEFIPGKYDIL